MAEGYEHERSHWSNWHITVNTNRHERTDAERTETARVLADAFEDCVTESRIFYSWVKHFRDGGQDRFTRDTAGAISRVRARVALEQGPQARNRSIHAHIILEIEHRTRLQINNRELLLRLEQLTGWYGMNISSRFVKGDGEDKEYLLRYLQKDGMPRRAAADPDNARLQQSDAILDIEEHK